jgi:hypothetical protein
VGQVLGALIQFMITAQICSVKAGVPQQEVVGVIIPACGLSIALGSLSFFLQARQLCRAEGRRDVTAQPQGISAIIFFAYVLMIMTPEYQQTGDFKTAWSTCLFAVYVVVVIIIIIIIIVWRYELLFVCAYIIYIYIFPQKNKCNKNMYIFKLCGASFFLLYLFILVLWYHSLSYVFLTLIIKL